MLNPLRIAKIEIDSNKIKQLFFDDTKNQLSKKLEMIGFSSVIVDPDGYSMGKLNLVMRNDQ